MPEISKHNLGTYSSASMDVTDEIYNQETVHQAAFVGIFSIFTAMGMIDKNKHGAENFTLRRYEYCLKMLNLLEGKERLFDTPQDEIYRL